MIPLHDGWGWHPTQTDHIHTRHVQCAWGIGMLSQGHIGAPLYSTGQVDTRFWIFLFTCGVEMMQLYHDWGSHPPHTASHIHTRHIQSVWAICMLSHRHMGAPLYRYTGQVVPRFWIFLSLVEWKGCHNIMVEADIRLRLFPISILDICKVFEVLICCLTCIWVHSYIITEDGWPQILGFWVTCGVEMMPFHHSWGSHPPQTASQIRIRHIQRVWGIGMPSQGHMDAPLSFHQPSWQQILEFWSFVEWKWCNFIIVEAEIHLRLYPTSILDIYKVFEVLVCCLTSIRVHPYFSPPAMLAPDFGILGHLWSGNYAIAWWLRLTSTSDCFSHLYWTCTKCLRYWYAGSQAYGCTFIIPPARLATD